MIKNFDNFINETVKHFKLPFGHCFITKKGLLFGDNSELSLAKQVYESDFKMPNVPIKQWYVDYDEYEKECQMHGI